MVRAAGFENAKYRNMTMGMACTAFRLENLKCAARTTSWRLIRTGATLGTHRRYERRAGRV